VNQRSEHLSDAQIEQYGKRASGAGPETEAWVETHLDDCSSCRSRVLEFQRTQFALLPDPKVNTVSSSNCPSEEDLRTLAAGLCSNPLAAELTAHAVACGHCGPLLREYQEDFSDDVTPEEQTALAQLRSASPEWQQQKAREMLQPEMLKKTRAIPEPVPATDWRRFFSWKWIMVPALPAVALIAVGIWYLQRDTPEKVAKLEAQAFTEQRTTEMRVPYAAYADFNQKRSGDIPSRSSLPQSLNRAADKIAKHLQTEPDNPQWLMLSARLDLWDSNYKAALSSLEKISDSQAIQSPEYLMTRAFALFQKSEALKESQGYSEAVDLLGKALQKAPDDPVLLFNQAIACEKTHSYECAESDWNRLLAVEKDPQWTAEARKHLDQIKEKKTSEH
jgi:cytochrome c-type biogenesis protein CcmH/NrfG